MIRGNLPLINDSAGRSRRELFPSMMRGGPVGIPPHGNAVILVPYDVAPTRQAYTMKWWPGSGSVALVSFDWP